MYNVHTTRAHFKLFYNAIREEKEKDISLLVANKYATGTTLGTSQNRILKDIYKKRGDMFSFQRLVYTFTQH